MKRCKRHTQRERERERERETRLHIVVYSSRDLSFDGNGFKYPRFVISSQSS